MGEATRWVWIPDEEQGFVKAQLVAEDETNGTCSVRAKGEVITLKASDVDKVNPTQFDRAGDIGELTYLNEPSVVYNLNQRYAHDQIYTYSGLFLVAVNPYKSVPIYGDEIVAEYKNKRREDGAPHIYAVAEQAYREMLETKANQSILVTGESGAGKTENTKKVIRYLSAVTGSKTKSESGYGIDEQILQTNPVLEAFGNAQTIRNANSSRFGKFIRIEFGPKGRISGASIEFYMLEKSRVITQAPEERNYHIFYQLLKGASKAQRTQLGLENASIADFAYLKNGVADIDGVDDAHRLQETETAFKIMGFSAEAIASILEVVATVLHLGNIQFTASSADQGRVANPDQVAVACKLLGVSADLFGKAMLRPRVRAGTELVSQSRTAAQAQFAVDALAKALYERLFGYIVSQLNVRLGSGTNKTSFIGVLDIAGFEIFRHNSFEQLFINYTNEKLQQFFNHHMFVLEQEEYIKEDIEWDYVDYGSDLQPTIDLIERISPMGIFSCLDEECVVPQATDATFTDKLVERWNGHNAKFSASRLHQGFIVNHYAMAVEYSTDGWLDKNRDPLSDSVTELMASSSKSLVKQLFNKEPDTGRRTKMRTVAQKHREQLNNLMAQLESTSPHFVRCIIPNKSRQPDEFDNVLVLDQLRCNGVLEGIRLARAGYPNRLDFREFCSRYHVLVPNEPSGGSSQRACSAILQRLKLDEDTYKVGLTKVFFRGGVLAHLEDRLDTLVKQQTLAVQSLARGYIVRKWVRAELHRKEATKVLAKTFKTWKTVHDDPWWKLLALQRPLLDSEDDLDANRKEMRIQKLQENLVALRAESDKQSENLVALEKESKELRDERDCLRADMLAEAAKHTKDLEHARGKTRKLTQQLDELRGDNDKVVAELEATKLKVVAEAERTKPLAAKVAELEALLKTETGTTADLRQQLGDAVAAAETAKTAAAAVQTKHDEIHKKLGASTTAFKQLETEHTKLIDTHKTAQTERDAVQARLDKLGREHKDLETKHRSLGEELSGAKTSSAALETKSKQFAAQERKWKDERAKMQAAYDELAAKLAAADKSGAAKDTAIAAAKSSAAKDVDAKVAEVKKTLAKAEEKLREELATTKTELTTTKTELATTKTELTAAKNELATTKTELERKVRDLTLTIEDKVSYTTQLEAKLEQLDAKIEQQQREIADHEAAALSTTPQTAIAVAGAGAKARQRAFRQFSPSSLDNAQQEFMELQNELASERANTASLREELLAGRRELAEVSKLKERLQRLQREKAQLADEKSQMMFSTQSQRSQLKELEIEKAKSSEVKKLQSEIRVLKLQLVRSERTKNAAVAAAEAAAATSTDAADVAQLTQKLRVAELAKVQLQQQLLRQQAQLERHDDEPLPLPVSRFGPTRIPSAPRAAEPNLVVRKRDIPSALRVISNDRRVSEQIYVDGTEKQRTVSTSQDLQETVAVYKRRAEELHSELEKAELVVAAAVRNEEAAQEQMATLKQRVASLESSQATEVGDLTKQLRALKRQLADNELDLSVARENESLCRDLEAQLRSLSSTMDDIKGERDRLLVAKQKLEKRLEHAADLSERPRRLVEQLTLLQRDVKTRDRVVEDMRWQIERRDKLVDQLKRTLADSDSREEQLREQVDRLQAVDSAKDVALRRSKRDVAQAREQALILERELLSMKPKQAPKSYSTGPAFI